MANAIVPTNSIVRTAFISEGENNARVPSPAVRALAMDTLCTLGIVWHWEAIDGMIGLQFRSAVPAFTTFLESERRFVII